MDSEELIAKSMLFFLRISLEPCSKMRNRFSLIKNDFIDEKLLNQHRAHFIAHIECTNVPKLRKTYTEFASYEHFQKLTFV